MSVGVASLPDHATTVDGLVDEADSALYRAKGLGKNRVEAGRDAAAARDLAAAPLQTS